jgi:hypothetical protein
MPSTDKEHKWKFVGGFKNTLTNMDEGMGSRELFGGSSPVLYTFEVRMKILALGCVQEEIHKCRLLASSISE